MRADSLNMIRWWVDASYGVHCDCKGHTGAIMSMGKGATVNISRTHKLNTGSSTEAELVSIADVLGMMMWCKYCMEAQEYTIDNNILYQDNKSNNMTRLAQVKIGRYCPELTWSYYVG